MGGKKKKKELYQHIRFFHGALHMFYQYLVVYPQYNLLAPPPTNSYNHTISIIQVGKKIMIFLKRKKVKNSILCLNFF